MPPGNFGSRLDQALATPDASMPAELPEALGLDDIRDALAAPIADAPLAPEHSSGEGTEPPALERRVQALERLLQALLVQLAESTPDLLARLDAALSASSLTAGADDDKAIDSHAAALLRSALRTDVEVVEESSDVADEPYAAVDVRRGGRQKSQLAFRPPPFHFRKVGGVWRLTMDRAPRPAATKEEQ